MPAQPSISSTRLRAFRIAALVVVLALVLGAGEVALRIGATGRLPLVQHFDPAPLVVEWIEVPGGGRAPIYEPGQVTAHCFDRAVGGDRHWDSGTAVDGTPVGCITYRISERGFRDGAAAPANREIVAILGDSFTFGEGVSEGERTSERLAAQLEEAQPGRFVVLNRGIQGLNLDAELNLYRARIRAERPSVVVLAFVPNDAQPFGETLSDGTFLRAAPWRLPGGASGTPWWRHSRVLDWLSRRIAVARVGSATVDHVRASFSGESGSRFDTHLEALAAEVRADGARLVLLIFPMTSGMDGNPEHYAFHFVHEHVQALAARLGLPFVDVYDAVSAWPRARLWAHPTDPHPSPELHELAAERLVPVFAP